MYIPGARGGQKRAPILWHWSDAKEGCELPGKDWEPSTNPLQNQQVHVTREARLCGFLLRACSLLRGEKQKQSPNSYSSNGVTVHRN